MLSTIRLIGFLASIVYKIIIIMELNLKEINDVFFRYKTYSNQQVSLLSITAKIQVRTAYDVY